MSEEKSCNRCGDCCKAIVLLKAALSPESRKYMDCHGLKEDQGFYIIPHVCQHLKTGPQTDQEAMRATSGKGPYNWTYCDIHESPDRPKVCQKWTGQKRIGNSRIYCPPGCVFHKENNNV